MTDTKRAPHFLSEGALVLTAIIWGATFALIKSAISSASPSVFISLRFSIAALMLLPFVFKKLSAHNALQWKQALLLGLIYYSGYATQTVGLQYTTATKSAFITGMFVIFTPILQTVFERRLPSAANLFAIVLAFTGVIFLSSRGNSLFEVVFQVGSNFTIGDFLTLICAIVYAGYIVYLDMIGETMDYLFLTFVQIALTAVLSTLSIGAFHLTGIENARFIPGNEVLFAIFYTATFATLGTTVLQTRFQRAVSPVKASIIFSLEPIFAAIFAFIILSERITAFGFAGAALIFSGLILSELLSKD
jgi:drug/metabolite transporter (DMT)-like permease